MGCVVGGVYCRFYSGYVRVWSGDVSDCGALVGSGGGGVWGGWGRWGLGGWGLWGGGGKTDSNNVPITCIHRLGVTTTILLH